MLPVYTYITTKIKAIIIYRITHYLNKLILKGLFYMKKTFASSFNRLLISYIAIVLIPVFVIFLYFYPKLNKTISKQILQDSSIALKNTQKRIDSNLNEIYHIYVAISSNAKLSPYYLQMKPYNRLEGKEELENYLATNKFIDDIYIYIKEIDVVLGKKGISEFDENYFNFINWSFADIKHTMSKATKLHVHPSETMTVAAGRPFNVVPFIMPVHTNNTTIMILINEEAFFDIFQSTYPSQLSNTMIFDEEGKLLLSDNPNMSREFLNDITYQVTKYAGTNIYEIGNEKYIMSLEKSEVMDLTYVNIMPYSEVFNDIRDLQVQTILLTLCLIIIGGMIAYLLSKINYRPIKAIIDLFNDNNANNLNDYKLIQKNIKDLYEQYDTINEQFNESLPASKEYLLKMLINNQITTLDQFNRMGTNIGIHIQGDIFNVTSIKVKLKDSNNIAFTKEEPENLKRFMNDNITGEFSLGLQRNSLFLISGSRRVHALKLFLNEIYKYFTFSRDCKVYIGISDDYKDFASMHIAYNQALSVINYQIIKGKTGLFYHNDLPQIDGNEAIYPARLINDFKNNILHNNIDLRDKNYNKLMDILKKQDIHTVFIKNLVHDIYTILLNFNRQFNDTLIGDTNFLVNIFENDYSLDDMIKNIEALYKRLFIKTTTKKEDHLITEILFYINEHYIEDDMSLQKVAEEFNMSTSNLSHYFKKHTKVNFLAYIKYLRIDEAKKLLTTTELPVNDISKRVGFFATSSFNRTFKKEVSMSPGQYRLENT